MELFYIKRGNLDRTLDKALRVELIHCSRTPVRRFRFPHFRTLARLIGVQNMSIFLPRVVLFDIARPKEIKKVIVSSEV